MDYSVNFIGVRGVRKYAWQV